MKSAIQELIELSREFGNDPEYVIGGGGNTSWKNNDQIYVKASGTKLGTLSENDLICLDRKGLEGVISGFYPADPVERDRLFLEGLMGVSMHNSRRLRPSVETPLHHLIQYAFVVHTHPTRLNALLCSQRSQEIIAKEFPPEVLYVEYTDPGFVLFSFLKARIENYRTIHGKDPNVIMVQNHGVFISADSPAEVRKLYGECIGKVNALNPLRYDLRPEEPAAFATRILPALRMMVSDETIRVASIRINSLVRHFTDHPERAPRVLLPFTPDNIVYCKARPLYVTQGSTDEETIQNLQDGLMKYRSDYGSRPKIILVQGVGLIAVDENMKMVEILLDVFQDLMKISFLSETFGGPHFLNEEQIRFIENWESENYRHSLSKGVVTGKVSNRIAIVTGAAQGFGEGIAENLFKEGANVVIADLNEGQGAELAKRLNSANGSNRAVFVRVDVSEPESVRQMIDKTVQSFGGLDLLISNAGILFAGGLEEMTPQVFEKMTRVNYEGYFLCTQAASGVFKTQFRFRPGYFTDILQINSKSGLRGSRKNFTYAGGKFGGIGLTQSFALELIEYGIKVNAICPGNFFDGPLWSDPQNGLFVQYLRSGKVPGARSVEDVKKFYEQQVPAGRGCTVEDVMKAVYYAIDQQYETGQAIPVTGGQVMLS